MPAKNIDEVVRSLDEIVARSRAAKDSFGLFAALYRAVTRDVARRIEAGFFDDGSRMNRLDTHFANRYLDAYESFREGRPTTRSWRIAFEASAGPNLIALQELLLGMNAHINLDLGIAASELFSRDELPSLQRDFDRINEILGELLERAQAVLGRFSPLLGILDQIGGKTDEQVANFSIERARKDAWVQAQILVRLPSAERSFAVDIMDRKVAFLGRLLASPEPVLASGIRVIQLTESRDRDAIAEALRVLVP